MARYKVLKYRKRTRQCEESDIFPTPSAALFHARQENDKYKVITIVRESDNEFHPHPDNAGQWYLYRIVK